MSVTSKRLRHGFKLDVKHSERLIPSKRGLYFQSIWHSIDSKLSDTEVVELRDWLSRYIAEFITKNKSPQITGFESVYGKDFVFSTIARQIQREL
jgi:hypothetical protein